MRKTLRSFTLVSFLVLATAAACGGGEESGENGGSGGSGLGGAMGGQGLGGGGFILPGTGSAAGTGGLGQGGVTNIGPVEFGDTECSDGIDNDNSGLIDGFDPECSGPLDDDEGSFATGIPGDNSDEKKQDCFFDGNSGAGEDDCDSSVETQSQQCIDFCSERVPNGCDCFGCCEVRANGTTYTVKLGGSCSDLDVIADGNSCESCTMTDECQNECGECELCAGKTLADLPDSCRDSGSGGGSGEPGYVCDGGATKCTTSAECSGGYCQFGCCMPPILK